MLLELRIKNFAIIEALNLEFKTRIDYFNRGNRSREIDHHGGAGYVIRAAGRYGYVKER